jgi:hypothetical protein
MSPDFEDSRIRDSSFDQYLLREPAFDCRAEYSLVIGKFIPAYKQPCLFNRAGKPDGATTLAAATHDFSATHTYACLDEEHNFMIRMIAVNGRSKLYVVDLQNEKNRKAKLTLLPQGLTFAITKPEERFEIDRIIEPECALIEMQ